VLRRLTVIGVALALGGGGALGVAACGEKRGSVQFKGGTAETSTATTSKTTTSP
jgi:hypothetical protein